MPEQEKLKTFERSGTFQRFHNSKALCKRAGFFVRENFSFIASAVNRSSVKLARWPQNINNGDGFLSTWTKLNLYFSPQLFGPQSVTSVV
jgi:hypothetical protein